MSATIICYSDTLIIGENFDVPLCAFNRRVGNEDTIHLYWILLNGALRQLVFTHGEWVPPTLICANRSAREKLRMRTTTSLSYGSTIQLPTTMWTSYTIRDVSAFTQLTTYYLRHGNSPLACLIRMVKLASNRTLLYAQGKLCLKFNGVSSPAHPHFLQI